MSATFVSADGVLANFLDGADLLLQETFGVGFDFWRMGEGESPLFVERTGNAVRHRELRP